MKAPSCICSAPTPGPRGPGDADLADIAVSTGRGRVERPRNRQRSVIVNADDFGFSPGVSRGIVAAHERGIVTSASLMVRWPAAAYGRAHPALSVGLHVDLGQDAHRDGRQVTLYRVIPLGRRRGRRRRGGPPVGRLPPPGRRRPDPPGLPPARPSTADGRPRPGRGRRPARGPAAGVQPGRPLPRELLRARGPRCPHSRGHRRRSPDRRRSLRSDRPPRQVAGASRWRRIFPLGVLGRSARNSIRLGIL